VPALTSLAAGIVIKEEKQVETEIFRIIKIPSAAQPK
jgi:hypothetical protein